MKNLNQNLLSHVRLQGVHYHFYIQFLSQQLTKDQHPGSYLAHTSLLLVLDGIRVAVACFYATYNK